MRAGALDQRITLLRREAGADDWGQDAETWVEVVIVWADVRFQNGREFIAAGAQTAQVAASVRIRPRAVDPAMRVRHKGVTYNITAVLPGPRNDYIDLAISAVT